MRGSARLGLLALLAAAVVAIAASQASAACYFANGTCAYGTLNAGQSTPATGFYSTSESGAFKSPAGPSRRVNVYVRRNVGGSWIGPWYSNTGTVLAQFGSASNQQHRCEAGSGGYWSGYCTLA